MNPLASLVRMAIKFESASPVRCESVRRALTDLFPEFGVDVDQDDTRTCLEKAMCPMRGALDEPNPLVFGETKSELLRRIQFSGRG